MTNHVLRRCVTVIAFIASACAQTPAPSPDEPYPPPVTDREKHLVALFEALRPVKLKNCEFQRFGDAADGGYVMCGNLIDRAESLYSYGISATDEWGCGLSARLQKPVHQYDCFELKRPACGGATPVFHEECVGPRKETIDGRPYDTVEAQIARNGDAGKRLVMKMDVEGSEWPSFLSMPESVLQQIDQLSVEFHGVEKKEYVTVINKLRQVFYVVNLHYNNWACAANVKPLQGSVFEVLFVNKNIGVVDEGAPPVIPNPLDAPNNRVSNTDCQPTAATYRAAIESKSPR